VSALPLLSRHIRGPRVLGIGTLLAAILLIEILIRLAVINPYVVPLPSAIVQSFGRVIAEEHVPSRFLLTTGESLGAGFLVAVVGVPLGFLMHRYTNVRTAFETWVAAFSAAPIVLAYPLFLVIFGRSALTIIMIGFAAGIAPVILKTIEGLSGVRRALINVGQSFRLTPWQQFWKIAFPAAVPTIFTGIRLGLIFALINVVGVEFLINFGGLGQLINELAERYDLPGTYAAIVFVILVSVVFFDLVQRIERWLRPAA
jgi:ABC-type nitrate/sulfonate/bicarbonate transport system permease component